MNRPLIPPTWRVRVALIGAVALTGFVALASLVAGGSSTSFDSWMFEKLYAHIGGSGAAVLLGLSSPALSIGLSGAVGLFALVMRRLDVAALAALGPALSVVLTKWAFKPLLGRTYGTSDLHFDGAVQPIDGGFALSGVFPSGHESAVAATACVLAVVAFQLPLTRRTRAMTLAALAVWTLLAALGLVRNFWHYATDTIGAMLLATVVVLGVAFLIDRYGEAVFRRLRAARERQLDRG